jgi:nucleoside-diphosphate-sugar epimerase
MNNLPTSYPIQHVIITGATGYIGSRLIRIALAQQRTVTVLGRTSVPLGHKVRFERWELGDPLPVLDLHFESTALLHLAHDWRDRSTDGINLRGTRLLLQSARARRLKRFVFVSSQSARGDALNAYGRIKYTIEQSVVGPDTVSARVGLVYGGARRGMYGLLTRLVSLSPLLLMIDPDRRVQPIHLEEVCRGLLALSDSGVTGWIGLAGPDLVTFGDFLKILAHEGFSSSLRIVPIPSQLALFAAAVSETIPFGLRIDKERILGLAGTQPMDCGQHLVSLSLSVMRLRQGLRSDPIGAKALLSEGRVLCSFILAKRVSGSLLRRYVRAIRAVDPDPGPLLLPRLAVWRPALLRFIEPFGGPSNLARRLRMATALSAASMDALAAREASARVSRFAQFLSILMLVAVEIVAFPCRRLFVRRD